MSEESNQPGNVTQLLRAVRGGNEAALDQVLELMYDELRALAQRQLSKEFQARSLDPTALVHEAYLKLARASSLNAADRTHFLSLAAKAMRQVLVDHARRRSAAKRDDAWKVVTLTDMVATSGLDTEDMLALDDALARLDDRQRRIVECRFFGGMDDAEIAAVLGVTERTVRRDWVKARELLGKALS
jgi:RNA polymerase sigma factor (TIGR02999 family)